jgi:hypothetical protein
MRLVDTLHSLQRRWYILLAGLIATLAVAYGAFTTIAPSYQAEGRVLLMPPPASVGAKGNPFLFLGGMGQALDVLVERAGAENVVKPINDAHPGTGYTVTVDYSTSAPVVLITATGKDPAATMAVMKAALQTVPDTLQAMQDQADLRDPLRIQTTTLVVDRAPTKNVKNQLTITIIAVGAGAVGTVVLTGFIDGWLVQRRLRHQQPKASHAALVADGTPDPSESGDAADELAEAADGAPAQHASVGRRGKPQTAASSATVQ